jgi:hypothetical protein
MKWPGDSTKRRVQHALAISRWAYVPLVLACLAYAIYRASDVVLPMLRHAHPLLLLAAVVAWSALQLLTPVFSWLAMRDLGAGLRYRDVLRIYVARLPAKYLPGGIWHTVSRMADFHRAGIERPLLARLVALENTVPLGVAALLGGGLTAIDRPRMGMLAAVVGVALLCVVFVLLRRRPSARGGISPAGFAAAVLASAAFWVLASLAFTCYWAAYPTDATTALLARVPGAYMLAWAAGFAAVFAPQGVGVFEATIGMLLKGTIPLAGTALIAAGFRVVILAADLLAFCALQLLRKARAPAVIDRP